MEVINAISVSDALEEALHRVHSRGIREESRNGTVLVMPEPVTTIYRQPQQRVLFSPMRDANPFFHLCESLWMLAGKNDLAYPLKFNKRFGEYSDDGKTIWGAYGWRWRDFFGYDQLNVIVSELKKNPNSRRCVLSMWNAMPVDGERDHHSGVEVTPDLDHDLHKAVSGGKDVPCNTHAYFEIRGGVLNMTVLNRSNDMLWGCYGANAVHFSILLEYMAAKIGVPMGVYRQVSNNLHLYTDIISVSSILDLARDVVATDRYTTTHRHLITPRVVDVNVEAWELDLKRFIARDGIPNDNGWRTGFFRNVARPLYMAHDAWRDKRYDEADDHAEDITSWDWRIACMEWLDRRRMSREAKEVNARG